MTWAIPRAWPEAGLGLRRPTCPLRIWRERLDAAKLVSKSKISLFDGRRLQDKVLRTVVDGRTVFGADQAADSQLTNVIPTSLNRE
jgi:hypothetical protein